MLSQEESQSVAEELSNRIRAYKRKRPNLSSQNIAKRFGMSASTFNRIENLDIKTPTFEQIVRVLSGTGHDEDLVRFVEVKFPHLSHLITKKYVERFGEQRPVMEAKVREYLINSRYTKMLTFLLSKKNINRKVFKEEFGNDGLTILDELIQDNVVLERDGLLLTTTDYHYIPSVSDVRDIFINLLQTAFDVKGAEERKSANLISVQVKTFNAQKILPIMHDKLSALHHEFESMFKNPDYAGDDPIYLGLVCDTLIPNQIFVKGEVEK